MIVAQLLALLAMPPDSSLAPAQGSDVRACATAETLASYPSPAFLENLIVEPSGRVLFTSYLAREIIAYAPGGTATRLAELPAHPVSILPLGDGYLVAAHGTSFTAGPAFTTTNQFLLLDRAGKLIRQSAAPDARFLNGMVALDDGSVLIADSILGRIWRLDPASGALSIWLDDPALAADATGADPRPGVNGLKRKGSELFISNSFTGRIHALPLTREGKPGGALRTVATPGRVDDFAISGDDGGIYLATHTDTVLHAAPAGMVRTVLPEGGDGSTAVALVPGDTQALYVLTTGGLFEGGKAPARLLKMSLPGGDAMCAR